MKKIASKQSPKVEFKQRKREPVKRRPSFIHKILQNLRPQFAKSQKTTKHKRLILQRKAARLIINLSLVIIVFVLLAGITYFGIKTVINLKTSKIDDPSKIKISEGNVVGFNDVPIYPGSEFIFEQDKEDPTVKAFLSQGQSVYRLPPSTSYEEVVKFYSAELPKQNWKQVLSVPLQSEDKRPGEYWIKENVGLRIYSLLNDVWYQTISLDQAQSGLSEEVQKEIERKILISSSQAASLLPDYPWKLNFPGEYIATYRVTDIANLSAVELRKIGDKNSVILEPIGFIGGKDYASFFDDFIKKYNERIKKENKDVGQIPEWRVVSTSSDSLNGKEILRVSITSGTENGTAIVIGNEHNTAVYTLVSFTLNDPFYSYVVENLKEPEGIK